MRLRRGTTLAAQVERLEDELQALSNRVAGLDRSAATAREELQRLRELTVQREAELRARHQDELARIHEDVAAQDSVLRAVEELLAASPNRQFSVPDLP